MKNLLQSKTFRLVAVVAVLLLVAVGVVLALDLPTTWERRRAINDIRLNRDVEAARKRLMDLNDRQGVLDAIKDALDEGGDTVDAKQNLLTTLSSRYFNQPRIIERALNSDVKATQRAAAFILYGAPDRKAQCGEIALEWLADDKADSRSKAVLLCKQLDIRKAQPLLLALLDHPPESDADLGMMRHALAALAAFKPEGLTDRLMGMAEDGKLPEILRADALDTLASLNDAPRDRIQEMALRLLQDRNNSVTLRVKMAAVLRRPDYADDKTWYALESIVKDPAETDYVTQRTCLDTLTYHVPLDRLRQLLLDRAVYLHPYPFIRSDVAVALGAMDVRERVVLDIMAEYLTFASEDPKWQDTQNLVRREAWITLWQLSGVMVGVEESNLFRMPPPAFRDDDKIRANLLKGQWTRPGLTREAWEATAKPAADLARMREIKQHYQDPKILNNILERWERDEQARKEMEAREKAGDGDGPQGPVGPVGPGDGGNIGPVPPGEDDGGK